MLLGSEKTNFSPSYFFEISPSMASEFHSVSLRWAASLGCVSRGAPQSLSVFPTTLGGPFVLIENRNQPTITAFLPLFQAAAPPEPI